MCFTNVTLLAIAADISAVVDKLMTPIGTKLANVVSVQNVRLLAETILVHLLKT
jgi:hypothetical protein